MRHYTDAAAIDGVNEDNDDVDEDEKDEKEKDISVQRTGRQCTYSSTRGGEESGEWWNKGASSVQLTSRLSGKHSKYLTRYFPHS